MKYKSKVFYIEAEQFLPGKIVRGVYQDSENGKYYVITIQGQKVFLDYGEWVIEEDQNRDYHYPCNDIIFKKKYETA